MLWVSSRLKIIFTMVENVIIRSSIFNLNANDNYNFSIINYLSFFAKNGKKCNSNRAKPTPNISKDKVSFYIRARPEIPGCPGFPDHLQTLPTCGVNDSFELNWFSNSFVRLFISNFVSLRRKERGNAPISELCKQLQKLLIDYSALY